MSRNAPLGYFGIGYPIADYPGVLLATFATLGFLRNEAQRLLPACTPESRPTPTDSRWHE